MIWSVIDDAELAVEADALCSKLADLPTEILGLTKRVFAASNSNDLNTQLDLERDLQRKALSTPSHKEGLSAFFEKRAPNFHNNSR